MSLIELAAGSLVLGLGAVLAVVGVTAYRKSGVRQLIFTAAAFAAAAAGGFLLVVLTLTEGEASGTAISSFSLAIAASLVLFYFALIGRND